MKTFRNLLIACVVLVGVVVVPLRAFSVDSAGELIALGVQPAVARKLVQIVNTLASPFSNNTWVTVRNAANSANINALKVDGTDDTVLNADSGDVIKLQVAGTTEATLDDDKLTFSGASVSIVPGATSLLFRNNADNASNITILDGGSISLRNTLSGTFFASDVTAAVSAAGSSSSDATALTTAVNVVTTAAAGTGVTLPSGAVGATVLVQNRGANDLELYPPTSGTINGATATTGSITLAAATRDVARCTKYSSTAWFCTVNAGPQT